LIVFLISIKAKANHNGEGILNTFPEKRPGLCANKKYQNYLLPVITI